MLISADELEVFDELISEDDDSTRFRLEELSFDEDDSTSFTLDELSDDDDSAGFTLEELISDEDDFALLLLDSTGLSELDDSSGVFELDDSFTFTELEEFSILVELEEASVELDDSTFLELEDFSSLALLLEIASSFSLDEEISVSMPVSSFLEGPLELSSPQATKPTTVAQNPKAIRPLVKDFFIKFSSRSRVRISI